MNGCEKSSSLFCDLCVLSWLKIFPFDRMRSPLEYNALHRAYTYTEPTFMLPAVQMNGGFRFNGNGDLNLYELYDI